MTGPDPSDDRPQQPQAKPDETLPLTHRPYGQPDEAPPLPPSGPSFTSPSGEPPAIPPPPAVSPYGAPPATSYGQPPQGLSPYGQSPYGQPPYAAGPAYGMGYAQAHGRATTALVLGIISIASLVLAFFCGVTAPGFLTGPFAIWLGLSARKEIDANPSMYNNRGSAVAGFVMGIIGTVLGVLAIIVVALIILVFGLTFARMPQ